MKTHSYLLVNPAAGGASPSPEKLAAAAALEADASFVCVPFGTRNHFARDVGLDRRRLRATVNGERTRARALLVGNNEYEISLFTLGERRRLDQGALQVWAAAGLLPGAWHDRVAERVEIDLPDTRVRAAIDGEPAVLEPPLVFESLPRALRVRIPASEGGTMHDNPRPSEEEEELAQTERQNEEEAQRYPSTGQPDSPDDASE